MKESNLFLPLRGSFQKEVVVNFQFQSDILTLSAVETIIWLVWESETRELNTLIVFDKPLSAMQIVTMEEPR